MRNLWSLKMAAAVLIILLIYFVVLPLLDALGNTCLGIC